MQNNSNAEKIASDGQELLSNLERYLRLEATDKLTVLVTSLIIGVIAFALVLSAIFFLGSGLVITLEQLTGNEAVSYYAVGGIILLVLLVIYLLRKSLIENPVVRLLSASLLAGSAVAETPAPAAPSATSVDLHTLAKSLAQELDDYDEEGGRV